MLGIEEKIEQNCRAYELMVVPLSKLGKTIRNRFDCCILEIESGTMFIC
jgi:hypothetical protein